jgi:hypothetical protein
MPLAFESLSHGTVAFGFFNIESDMLLLENLFFFAPDFCGLVSKAAQTAPGRVFEKNLAAIEIRDRGKIGDLHGAIQGVVHEGFIGAMYLRHPFPARPEDFRQNPQGRCGRREAEDLIAGYGKRVATALSIDAGGREAAVGPFRFARSSFQALVNYVWRGGYPRWKDEIRPDYVQAMKKSVAESGSGIFEDMEFER